MIISPLVILRSEATKDLFELNGIRSAARDDSVAHKGCDRSESHMTTRYTKVLFLLFLLLAACTRATGPQDFAMNAEACDYCRMTIVDPRFKAEAVTAKGRIYRFDSIECLAHWRTQHAELPHTAWVTDFTEPTRWIPLEQAFILKSESRPSPMGGFLSAYATDAAFQQALQQHPGERVMSGAAR